MEKASDSASKITNSTSTPSTLFVEAGYCLFSYSVFNLILLILSGSGGPEATLNKITQLIAIFPVFFLGSILIFSKEKTSMYRSSRSLVQGLISWIVLFISLVYYICIPVSILNLYFITSSDQTIVSGIEGSLNSKRKEILDAVKDKNSVESIRSSLLQFPEITNVTFSSQNSLAEIRNGITLNIDKVINTKLAEVRDAQAKRQSTFSSIVRNLVIGCLISGISFSLLSKRLFPDFFHSFSLMFKWAIPGRNTSRQSTRKHRSLIYKFKQILGISR